MLPSRSCRMHLQSVSLSCRASASPFLPPGHCCQKPCQPFITVPAIRLIHALPRLFLFLAMSLWPASMLLRSPSLLPARDRPVVARVFLLSGAPLHNGPSSTEGRMNMHFSWLFAETHAYLEHCQHDYSSRHPCCGRSAGCLCLVSARHQRLPLIPTFTMPQAGCV